MLGIGNGELWGGNAALLFKKPKEKPSVFSFFYLVLKYIMPRKTKSRVSSKNNKSKNNKNKKSKKNNITKKKCYQLRNPWHDILMSELLKNDNNISSSQKKDWCKTINKLKKEGYSIICEANGSKKYKITTWDKVC